ncbi:Protein-lysine N-methyltransferase efm6 [Coemansia sp. RSA 552]|nr:Protein-lysine N-methyltransferase efm6 [Coemansia sp. RSA 552]
MMDFGGFIEYTLEVAQSEAPVRVLQDSAGTARCGVGSTVWDAGLVLAKYLERRTAEGLDLAGKTVLELGAGTGIVGIALARMQPQCRVVVTDKPELLPLLRRNIELSRVANARAECLDWTREEPLGAAPDMVLVSDGIWDRGLHGPLASTLARVASGAQTTTLLAYETREFAAEAEFMALWSRDFRFHDIKPAQQHPVMQSEDIWLFEAHLKAPPPPPPV